MAKRAERGFTIIEVMLFLAITSGLFAALMIGVGTGITQQRYLDSVRSYKALLQNQYSEVLNTRNEDVDQWRCSQNNDGSVVNSGNRDTRGTSKCVILGRAILIPEDGEGRTIVTSSVTGYDTNDNDNSVDDITALQKYQPKLGSFDRQTVELEWQAHLTTTKTAEQGGFLPSKATILILRSPATGLIKIFASKDPLGNSTNLSSLITQSNSSTAAIIKNCVDGDSGLLPKQLVIINPLIASTDAITTSDDSDGDCKR